MTHYLDASCCVAVLTPESGTARVVSWRETGRAEQLAISHWVHAEVASALAMKVRIGSLDVDGHQLALNGWLSLRQSFQILEISKSDFEVAARMVERFDLGLRAGDALHLAVAAAHGCKLVTLDERLARAAPQLGVSVATL